MDSDQEYCAPPTPTAKLLGFVTASLHDWLLRPGSERSSSGSPPPCCGEARPLLSQLEDNIEPLGRPKSYSLWTLETSSGENPTYILGSILSIRNELSQNRYGHHLTLLICDGFDII